MPTLNDVAELLMQLIARGGGTEKLDEVYRIIEQTPGSTEVTAEEGRDALLVAIAYSIQCLADYRLTLHDGQVELAHDKLREMVEHMRRIIVLCEFLHRSGVEALRLLDRGVSPYALPYYRAHRPKTLS